MKNVAGYDVSRLMAGSLGHAGRDHRSEPQGAARGRRPKPRCALNATRPTPCASLQRLGRPAPAAERQLLGARRWRGHAVCAPARRRGCRAGCVPEHGRHPAGQRHHRAPRLVCLPRPHPALVCPARAAARTWPCGACRCPPPRRCWRCLRAAQPLVEWHGALRWVQAPASAGDALRAAAEAVGGSASVL